MGPSLLLLLLLPALAQPAPTAASTAAQAASPAGAGAGAGQTQAGALAISADLRGEYLAGEPVILNFTLANGSDAPVVTPDLSARPWRVRFKLTLPSGQSQTRLSTPPQTEPANTWTIAPRGQKRVALEIPSGAALSPGSYTLAVEVDLGDRVETLAARPMVIAPARPVGGHIVADALVLERSGLQALWLHQAATGFDLYLTEADSREPTRPTRNRFLLHLDARVDARLTAGRPGDANGRYVFWPEGKNALRYVRLQAGVPEYEPRLLTLPWPVADLLGQGATDSKGGLQLPVWIPGPKGGAGELRLASVDDRGGLQLRKVLAMPARPEGLEITVDASGGVHVLVPRGEKLDLYTLRPDYGADLPVPGTRLWNAATGATMLFARFSSLPQTETQAGGLATLVVWMQGGAVQAQWYSLAGKPLQRLQGTPLASTSTLLAALPSTSGPPGLLVRDPDGGARYLEGGASTPLSIPAEPWRLVRDTAGRPVMLDLGANGGLRGAAIKVTATP